VAALGLKPQSARSPAPYAAQFVTGVIAWLLGFAYVALVAGNVGAIARAGWTNLADVFAAQSGVLESLVASGVLAAAALLLTVLFALPAGIASAQPDIGGGAGTFLNVMLRFGPAVPTVAFGAAAFVTIVGSPAIARAAAHQPLLTAAICLALLNMPIATARFRAIFRESSRPWMSGALASGATPAFTYRFAVVPRARRAIAAEVVNRAGLMLGETALVAVVLSACGSSLASPSAYGIAATIPLAVHLWVRLALLGQALSGPTASEALLFFAIVITLRIAGRLLRRPRRPAGAIP
jgi:ABC-type phosphate transport system permease subunit